MALPPLNYVPLNELDSVNNLLMSIGQSPVNSLAVPGVKDVSIAQLTLHNTSREVQTAGHWYNTDESYPLSADVNGNIILPANAIQVIPDDDTYVERAGKLYDTANHTFVIGKKVTATVIWFFPYTDIPQSARLHIERRAGRVFQSNIVGSQILYAYTKELEVEAKAEIDRANLRGKKTNFFNSPAEINRIYNRN